MEKEENSIRQLSGKMGEHTLKSWDQLPDLEIYKDQLLTYLSGRLPFEEEKDRLTGAMINNYIKAGVVPRTVGKRYQKEHIAALTAVCVLKQILPVGEVSLFLDSQGAKSDTEKFYERFLDAFDREGKKAGETMSQIQDDEAFQESILSFALSAYWNALACKQLLSLFKEERKKKKGSVPEPKEAQS